MQLQVLLFILVMLIAVPAMVIFANHEVFFIILSSILIVASVKNIHLALSGIGHGNREDEGELADELEDMADVDMKKLSTGAIIVKYLVIILFLSYCSFFLEFFIFKILLSVLILYWIYEIRCIVKYDSQHPTNGKARIKRTVYFMVNLGTIAVILLVTSTKLFGITL